MPYKIFLWYFIAITFYATAFPAIALFIAFHASKVTLLTLSLFSHSITLVIAYPLESHYVASLITHMGLLEESDSSDDFDGFEFLVK